MSQGYTEANELPEEGCVGGVDVQVDREVPLGPLVEFLRRPAPEELHVHVDELPRLGALLDDQSEMRLTTSASDLSFLSKSSR